VMGADDSAVDGKDDIDDEADAEEGTEGFGVEEESVPADFIGTAGFVPFVAAFVLDLVGSGSQSSAHVVSASVEGSGTLTSTDLTLG
jgi:hypothetical protein